MIKDSNNKTYFKIRNTKHGLFCNSHNKSPFFEEGGKHWVNLETLISFLQKMKEVDLLDTDVIEYDDLTHEPIKIISVSSILAK